MTTRTASCRCGQLRATATGEPVRVSVCHCLDCKKRSGSAFAVQARWPKEQVDIEGRSKTFVKVADSSTRPRAPKLGTPGYVTHSAGAWRAKKGTSSLRVACQTSSASAAADAARTRAAAAGRNIGPRG